MRKVTCICPTFGRAPAHLHLLQESLYWFTRQTYPDKELIILNDAHNQKLVCTVPQVRVINTATRYPTLGDKYNALVKEATGAIILPWEDDDISLPTRIEQAVEKLIDHDYFEPQQTWYEQDRILHYKHTHGCTHNASAYTKGLWQSIGGYDPMTGNQDQSVNERMREHAIAVANPLRHPHEWTYIYRWGVSNIHLSGTHGNEAMQQVWNNNKAEPGIIVLVPQMYRDYLAETEEIIKSL